MNYIRVTLIIFKHQPCKDKATSNITISNPHKTHSSIDVKEFIKFFFNKLIYIELHRSYFQPFA